MGGGNPGSINALGFVSVVSDDAGCRIGGLLILHRNGRPLEFHCTAPVKPNRAQEILYGPTLDEYLCGEQIGQALYAEIKTLPDLLLTDRTELLTLRHFIKQPVFHVSEIVTSSAEIVDLQTNDTLPQMVTHQRENIRLGVRFEYEDDLEAAGALDGMAASFDLFEPFARIYEAIAEAHGGGRSAA